MRLASRAFADGTMIPARYTCDGEDISPPLYWQATPQGTRSFVVLCDDPDAPAGVWHHWAAYDIPSDQSTLAEGVAEQRGQPFKQAINDFKRRGYGGPCPPHRHGPHHYRFQLLATPIKHLPLAEGASCQDVDRAARKHSIAEAILVGIYQR